MSVMPNHAPTTSPRTREATRCFACDADALEPFYEAFDVPVHSCVLVPDRQAAHDFPTGHIRLALCHHCGFVQNTLFDPAIVDYSQEYEETQACSPTFRAFARDLAEELDRSWDLRGKHVLEVGCGSRAEFLVLLCELTGCTGTGIDPSLRGDLDLPATVDVIPEHYDGSHTELTGDLVATRHTLEHIQPVAEFTDLLVASARRTPGAGVFIEVPDTTRILERGAFWDIYHEHASYFTRDSLTRLAEHCDLSVDRVDLAYDAQYLTLHGRPVPDQGTSAAGPRPLPDVAEFTSLVERRRGRIEDHISRVADRDGHVYVWGGGSKAVSLLSALSDPDLVTAVVDINPRKQGRFVPPTGHRVIGPTDLEGTEPTLVLVMNAAYEREVGAQLEAMGVPAELVALP